MEGYAEQDELAPIIHSEAGHELLDRDEGWCIGVRGDRLLRLNTEKHMISIANTGGGKGVSVAIPNLLVHEGSVLSVEIGGATYKTTSNFRRVGLGQAVHLIDPFGATGDASAHINLLDTLDPKSSRFFVEVENFAKSILKDSEGQKEQSPYWERTPRGLLSALLTFVKLSTDISDQDRHLPYLYKLLVRFPGEEWQELMKDFAAYAGPYNANLNLVGNYYAGHSDENIRSIVSTVQGAMRFASDDSLAKIISDSSFSLAGLRNSRISIYVVMQDAEDYGVHSAFLRLLVERSLAACPNIGDGGRSFKSTNDRVLFMLDEFTQLGKLDAVDSGMQTARQKGVTLWALFQDYGRLQHVYGEKIASSFMGAAACVQVFDVGDEITPKYVSERLGKRVVYLPGVQSTLALGSNENLTWSDSISQGTAETFSQGQTTGVAETWNESEAYGTGSSTSTSHTDSTSQQKTDSIGEANTTSNSTSVGTSDTNTKGTGKAKTASTSNGEMFGLNYFGTITKKKKEAIKDKDKRERSYQKNTGAQTSAANSTQESAARTKSSQTTTGDSSTRSQTTAESRGTQSADTTQFTQSFNFTKNIGRGGSRTFASNTGNASTKTSQGTSTKGGGRGSSTTQSYSLSYSPNILPKLDPAQVEEVLGSKRRQILFIRANNKVLKLIDQRSIFFENSGLLRRAFGPEARPVPEMSGELLAPRTPELLQRQVMTLDAGQVMNAIASLRVAEPVQREVFQPSPNVNTATNTAAKRLKEIIQSKAKHGNVDTYDSIVAAADLVERNVELIQAEHELTSERLSMEMAQLKGFHDQLNKDSGSLGLYRAHVRLRQLNVNKIYTALAQYEIALLLDIEDEKSYEEELQAYRGYLDMLCDTRRQWPSLSAPQPEELIDLGEFNSATIDLHMLERTVEEGAAHPPHESGSHPSPDHRTLENLLAAPPHVDRAPIINEICTLRDSASGKSMQDIKERLEYFIKHPVLALLSRDSFIRKHFFGGCGQEWYERLRDRLAETVVYRFSNVCSAAEEENRAFRTWFEGGKATHGRNAQKLTSYAAELLTQKATLDSDNDAVDVDFAALQFRYYQLRHVHQQLEIRRSQCHNRLMIMPVWRTLEKQTEFDAEQKRMSRVSTNHPESSHTTQTEDRNGLFESL